MKIATEGTENTEYKNVLSVPWAVLTFMSPRLYRLIRRANAAHEVAIIYAHEEFSPPKLGKSVPVLVRLPGPTATTVIIILAVLKGGYELLIFSSSSSLGPVWSLARAS